MEIEIYVSMLKSLSFYYILVYETRKIISLNFPFFETKDS